MYEIRFTPSGDLFARGTDREEMLDKLEHYTKHHHDLVLKYIKPKYRLVYVATKHHESVAMGTIQRSDEILKYEEAIKLLKEERQFWSSDDWRTKDKGEGFEIWWIGLEEVWD